MKRLGSGKFLRLIQIPKLPWLPFHLEFTKQRAFILKLKVEPETATAAFAQAAEPWVFFFFFFLLSLIFHLSHVLRHELDEFYPADMLLAILPRNSEKCSEL